MFNKNFYNFFRTCRSSRMKSSLFILFNKKKLKKETIYFKKEQIQKKKRIKEKNKTK